jgi:hypothetical protein
MLKPHVAVWWLRVPQTEDGDLECSTHPQTFSLICWIVLRARKHGQPVSRRDETKRSGPTPGPAASAIRLGRAQSTRCLGRVAPLKRTEHRDSDPAVKTPSGGRLVHGRQGCPPWRCYSWPGGAPARRARCAVPKVPRVARPVADLRHGIAHILRLLFCYSQPVH